MEDLDFTVKKGDSWQGAIFTIALSGGEPVNLTDAVITSQLKRSASDTCAVLSLSNGAGITILEPLSGKFQYDKQIIDITARAYSYDLQIKLADETVLTPFGGSFTVEQDVTN